MEANRDMPRLTVPHYLVLSACLVLMMHSAYRAFMAWQHWHGGAVGNYPREYERVFLSALASIALGAAMPLSFFMRKPERLGDWAVYVAWGALMAASTMLDQRSFALSPY